MQGGFVKYHEGRKNVAATPDFRQHSSVHETRVAEDRGKDATDGDRGLNPRACGRERSQELWPERPQVIGPASLRNTCIRDLRDGDAPLHPVAALICGSISHKRIDRLSCTRVPLISTAIVRILLSPLMKDVVVHVALFSPKTRCLEYRAS